MKNSKKKIMIVEDDIFVRDIYEVKISSEGMESISAENGVEAMKKLEKEGIMPDLILLDLNMPYLDGIGTLKKIRANEKFKNIPVILLTNLSDKENIETGMKMGAQDFLIKSHFTPSEVMEKINMYLK